MPVRQLRPQELPLQGQQERHVQEARGRRPQGSVSQGPRDTHACSPCSSWLRGRQVPRGQVIGEGHSWFLRGFSVPPWRQVHLE